MFTILQDAREADRFAGVGNEMIVKTRSEWFNFRLRCHVM